jgi:hypothetical protein
MNLLLKLMVTSLTILVGGGFGMQGLYAQDSLDRAAPQHLTADRSGHSLRIEGDAAALHVEVQQTTIVDVLSALESFNIRYRSSIALNDVVNGTYAGPPGRVLSRLLVGYNYAIKQGDAEIDVIIVSRYGEQTIPAPIIVQRRGSGE